MCSVSVCCVVNRRQLVMPLPGAVILRENLKIQEFYFTTFQKINALKICGYRLSNVQTISVEDDFECGLRGRLLN